MKPRYVRPLRRMLRTPTPGSFGLFLAGLTALGVFTGWLLWVLASAAAATTAGPVLAWAALLLACSISTPVPLGKRRRRLVPAWFALPVQWFSYFNALWLNLPYYNLAAWALTVMGLVKIVVVWQRVHTTREANRARNLSG